MHKGDPKICAVAVLTDETECCLRPILGIDISKREFHVALVCDERAMTAMVFENNAKGFRQLAGWLRKSGVTDMHACMEATGTYGEDLALFLHGEKHDVSVINPAQIKSFAASELLRVKTDSVDAAVIARFCRSHQPALWTPLAPEIRQLQSLVRRLEALKNDRRQQLNRIDDIKREPEIKALIKSFDRAIAETQRKIRICIRENAKMQMQCDLLCSIPGVAEQTASVLLAELFLRADFVGAKQVVAYAGLAPRIRQSGTSLRIKGGLCKTGNSRVRKSLFFPAIVAAKCNPILARMAVRLSARGKAKMAVVGALMRKLLVLCYGVLKSGQAFNAALGT